MDWPTRVAEVLANHPDDSLRASVQNDLGIVYQEHPIGNRRANLQRAIAAYSEALRFRPPDAAPLDYARTQANLGIVYEDLDDLPQAITCWREAARVAGDVGDEARAAKYTRWADDTQATLDAGG